MSIKDWFKKNNTDENDDLEDYDDIYYGEEESKSGSRKNARSADRDEDEEESYSPRRSARSAKDEDDEEGYSPRRSARPAKDEDDEEGYSPRRSARPVKDEDEDEDYYTPAARPARKPAPVETYEEPEYTGSRDSRDDDEGYYSPAPRPAAPAPEPAPAAQPEPAPAPAPAPVAEPAAPVNAGTLYFLPETYQEDRDSIVWGLRESHVVVINVSRLEKPEMYRLIDFIAGAKTALDAEMFRLDSTTIVLTPAGVEVDPDELEFPEPDEAAYDESEASDEEEGGDN